MTYQSHTGGRRQGCVSDPDLQAASPILVLLHHDPSPPRPPGPQSFIFPIHNFPFNIDITCPIATSEGIPR